MVYGDDCVGVSDVTLLKRRRAVMAAVTARGRGKDLDLALALADGSDSQRVDPAFDAHAGPIGRWADAIWHGWNSRRSMDLAIDRARARVARAAKPWLVVNGPAAAVVVTAARIGWTFRSSQEVVTDQGHTIHLDLDPPIVVRREVHEAVRRWRWARVLSKYPALEGGDANGELILKPIRRLLAPAARNSRWTVAQQAALRSAVVNGQWTQSRLASANMVDTDSCKLCDLLVASPGDEAPRGTLLHRHLLCPIVAAVAKGALGGEWRGYRALRTRARAQLGLAEPVAGDDPTPVMPNKKAAAMTVDKNAAGRNGDGGGGGNDTDGSHTAGLTAVGGQQRPHDMEVDGAGAGQGDYHRDPAGADHHEDDHVASRVPPSPHAPHVHRAHGIRGSPWQLSRKRCQRLRGRHHWEQWGLGTSWTARLRRPAGMDIHTYRVTIEEALSTAWGAAANAFTWTRALMRWPPQPEAKHLEDGTFTWLLEPADPLPRVTFYTDGSVIDAHLGRCAAVAWSFIALDADGNQLAAASGLTPSWVRDINGAEAWAILMAARSAVLGCKFVADSRGRVNAMIRGPRAAVGPRAINARVWKMIFEVFDNDGDTASLVWLPSHLTETNYGSFCKSDGTHVSRSDWDGNRLADAAAKAAANGARVSLAFRANVAATEHVVAAIARHVAWSTWAANNCAVPPHRDATTLTAAQKAEKRRMQEAGDESRANARNGSIKVVHDRPTALGGHALRWQEGVWRCNACWKTTAVRSKLAGGRCGGIAATKWAERERADMDTGGETNAMKRTHRRWMTGGVVWCSVCGSYADRKVVGLATTCKGPPPRSGGGRTTALHRLRRGLHPRTAEPLGGTSQPDPSMADSRSGAPGGRVLGSKDATAGSSGGDEPVHVPRCGLPHVSPRDPLGDPSTLPARPHHPLDQREDDAMGVAATTPSSKTTAADRLKALRQRVLLRSAVSSGAEAPVSPQANRGRLNEDSSAMAPYTAPATLEKPDHVAHEIAHSKRPYDEDGLQCNLGNTHIEPITDYPAIAQSKMTGNDGRDGGGARAKKARKHAASAELERTIDRPPGKNDSTASAWDASSSAANLPSAAIDAEASATCHAHAVTLSSDASRGLKRLAAQIPTEGNSERAVRRRIGSKQPSRTARLWR